MSGPPMESHSLARLSQLNFFPIDGLFHQQIQAISRVSMFMEIGDSSVRLLYLLLREPANRDIPAYYGRELDRFWR